MMKYSLPLLSITLLAFAGCASHENTASLDDTSKVLLIDIDPESPERGRRVPLLLKWTEPQGRLRPANLLTALPYPGFVLRASNWYGLAVVGPLRDPSGRAVEAADAVQTLLAGGSPSGSNPALEEGFGLLAEALEALDLAPLDVVSATVFETGAPAAVAPPLRAGGRAGNRNWGVGEDILSDGGGGGLK